MIDFPCRCGYQFSVPQELSGGTVQCPQCHNLADVPLLSELEHIERDGTFKVDEIRLKSEPERIKELRRIYLPGRQDENGIDIDLRVSMEDIQKAGVQEIPLSSPDGLIPGAPKYDPETGELIQPLDIKQDDGPRRAIPVPTAALNYARGDNVEMEPLGSLLGMLFRPGSLAVMGGLIVMHLIAICIWVPIGVGMLFAWLLQVPLYGMIFAHYAIVIEDVGPGGHDELPVPLRSLSFVEDIWYPSVNLYGSIIFCYAPALLIGPSRHAVASLSLAALGTLLFPVVFLTCCTSGILADLRPDRLFAVIGRCGIRYGVAVILWIVAMGVYGWSLAATALLGAATGSLFVRISGKGMLAAVSLPMLCVGVFLMHVFVCYMGLLYRRHGRNFPWVFQKHYLSDRSARRRKRNAKLSYSGERQSNSPPSPPAHMLHAQPSSHAQGLHTGG